MYDNEMQYSLEDAINEFVIPNCALQLNQEVQAKSGVAIPFLVSKPGAGKTSILKQKADELNWGILTIQPALKPIEEYGGIPKFKFINLADEKVLGTVWSIPDIMIELNKLSSMKDLVIFFWDDIHLCGPEHLALMQECFTERTIRGYRLPQNVAIVLAGNGNTKAGYRSLSSAIINRCVKLPVYTKFDDWKKNFAIKNEVHASIISFLEHPMYAKFFHEEEQIDDPWSSPRQWTRLSNFLVEYEKYQEKMMPINSLLFYSAGHVGKEAASQYIRYYEIFSKFDIENIFNNSENFVMPNDELDRYIFVFACLNYIVSKYTKKKSDEFNKKIVDIVSKLLIGDESLGILLLKELTLVDSKVAKIKIESIIQKLEETHNGLLKKILDQRKEDV